MNHSNRLFLTAILVMYLAGALNQGLSGPISVFGVQPDFLLVAVGLLSLFSKMRFALVVGAVAGMLSGCIVGADVLPFLITRLLAGTIGGVLVLNRFQVNWATSTLVTVVITIVANLVFMLLTSQSNIPEVLKATIISAVYNGVIALLVFRPVAKMAGVTNRSL